MVIFHFHSALSDLDKGGIDVEEYQETTDDEGKAHSSLQENTCESDISMNSNNGSNNGYEFDSVPESRNDEVDGPADYSSVSNDSDGFRNEPFRSHFAKGAR